MIANLCWHYHDSAEECHRHWKSLVGCQIQAELRPNLALRRKRQISHSFLIRTPAVQLQWSSMQLATTVGPHFSCGRTWAWLYFLITSVRVMLRLLITTFGDLHNGKHSGSHMLTSHSGSSHVNCVAVPDGIHTGVSAASVGWTAGHVSMRTGA